MVSVTGEGNWLVDRHQFWFYFLMRGTEGAIRSTSRRLLADSILMFIVLNQRSSGYACSSMNEIEESVRTNLTC